MVNEFDNSWDLCSFRDQVSGNSGGDPNGRLWLIITNYKNTHSFHCRVHTVMIYNKNNI